MKKNLVIYICISMLLFCLTGCGGTDDNQETNSAGFVVKWIDSSVFREVGNTDDISSLMAAGKKITSSDPSVVSVNGDTLEMKSKGYATLECTYDKRVDKYYYVVLTEDEFNNYEATFESNRVIMPIGAINKWSVGWSDFSVNIGNPAIVEVDTTSKGITVTAIGYGGSFITVTTNTGVILTYYVYAYPEHE